MTLYGGSRRGRVASSGSTVVVGSLLTVIPQLAPTGTIPEGAHASNGKMAQIPGGYACAGSGGVRLALPFTAGLRGEAPRRGLRSPQPPSGASPLAPGF